MAINGLFVVVNEIGSAFDAAWQVFKEVNGIFKAVVGIAASATLLAKLSGGWRFLARYFYDGGLIAYIKAAPRFALTLWAHPQGVRSDIVARYLVEFEILDPRPSKPCRWDYSSVADWKKETASWKASSNAWKKRRTSRLRDLVKHKDETGESLMGLSQSERLARLPILRVPNPAMIDKSRRAIARYFVVGAEIRSSTPGRFLSYVQLEEGYCSSNFLISGLMTRFDQDWDPIITNYGKRLQGRSSISHDLLEFVSFEFNCWLLWGPSLPLCSCEEWQSEHGKSHPTEDPIFLQYGFGDENNSIDVFIRNGRTKTFIERLARRLQRNGSAMVCASQASLYGRIKLGGNHPADQICSAQSIIRDAKHGRVYLEHEEFISDVPAQTESAYYSAYIWMMFLLCDRGGAPLNDTLRWKNLLPFFEHGNVADATTLRTLKNCLVVKACAALREIVTRAEDKEHGLSIRYVCAFDHSNCGHQLLVRHEPPSLQQLMINQMAGDPILKQALDEGRLRMTPDGDAKAVENLFASCHLPAIVADFYQDIERVSKVSHPA